MPLATWPGSWLSPGEGFPVGSVVGLPVGSSVGFSVGFSVGSSVGFSVGPSVGSSVGPSVGGAVVAGVALTERVAGSRASPSLYMPLNALAPSAVSVVGMSL